jgi:hypothetical protein
MSLLFHARHTQELTASTTVMTSLARSSKTDQSAMLILTKETNKDSGTMKLMGMVNTAFLPLFLVTVCNLTIS